MVDYNKKVKELADKYGITLQYDENGNILYSSENIKMPLNDLKLPKNIEDEKIFIENFSEKFPSILSILCNK